MAINLSHSRQTAPQHDAEVRLLSSPPMADALDRTALIQELARCISAVASGDDAGARLIIIGLARGLDAQQTLPGVPGPPTAMTAEMIRRSAVARLFKYWQERCDHQQAKMTPERAQAIIARLKAGYTEAEIMKAIDGAADAAYVDEASGKKFDDLTLICRNGSKLEDFIARGVRATGTITDVVQTNVGIEDQISDVRRKMAELKKAGRDTEYIAAARDLTTLMEKRKAKTS